MNLITRALNYLGMEKRTVEPSWDAVALLNAPTGKAESLSAVYSCVAAISETIASLPLVLYRREADEGREKAADHPLYKVLHDAPNDRQTALEFREMMQASVLLRGNAYARIIRGNDGQVRQLIPVPADRVTVLELDNGRLAYEYSDSKGNHIRLLQDEMFHLRHRSDNGILGISPITAARETVSLALAERDHGNATFTNGAKLSGVLKFPSQLTPNQRDNLRTSWNSQHQGGTNAGKTAILEAGVEYQTVSMSMDDAQWIEARQFSVEEVCRLFRMPPTVVGDLRHGNYSNSVEMARQFVTLTLRRHLTMWEQAISRSLLTEAGRRLYFAEHSVEGLLRGDSTNRADFYSKGITDGWLTIDEVRKLENLPKLPHAASTQTAPTQPAKDETGQAKADNTEQDIAPDGSRMAQVKDDGTQ